MSDFLNDDCSICLESLASRWENTSNKENPTLFSTPCEHYFHRECLLDWFNNGHPGNCCPMCKREMRWSEAIPVLGILKTASTPTELSADVRQACSNVSSQSTLNTNPRTVPQCPEQNARSVGSTAAAATGGVWDFREMYHESIINAGGVRVEGASRETANGNDWRNAPLRLVRDLDYSARQNVEQVQRDATYAQWIAGMEAEEIRRDTQRNAEQARRDAEYARTVADQERRNAEHARRAAEQGAERARRDAEKVRRGAELDSERARRSAEQAQRDVVYSRISRRIAEMQAELLRRDAERNAEQFQRDFEYTRRVAEQAQKDAENAQRAAEQGAERAQRAAEQARGNDYSRMEPPNRRGDSPYRRRDIDYFRGESPYRRRDTRMPSPYRRRDIH